MPDNFKKIRSYPDLSSRIQALSRRSPKIKLRRLGEVETEKEHYPFWVLETPDGPDKKQVCLSGGMHGDEPAGVESVMAFMHRLPEYATLLARIHFTFFPCVNPFGYEYDRRENSLKLDLNRQFNQTQPPVEIQLVKRVFSEKAFDFAYECHEDVDSSGYYLYELSRNEQTIGDEIIKRLSETFPINLSEFIEEMPVEKGLIRASLSSRDFWARIKRRGGWPQTVYFAHQGVPLCITAETPTRMDMEDRVAMHCLAFETALGLI